MTPETTGIPEMRSRIDEQRRAFASIAIEISTDEPTRYFSAQVIDAYEALDKQLRSLEFAHRHKEVGS